MTFLNFLTLPLAVDFAKGFDKILHLSILTSCIKFRFPKDAFVWITDFLIGRYHRIRCDDTCSSWESVNNGVSQGSVIEPLLFCMLIDDINPICWNSSIFKFADDVTILHFIRSIRHNNLQLELISLIEWYQGRSLSINFSKCKGLGIVTFWYIIARKLVVLHLFWNPSCRDWKENLLHYYGVVKIIIFLLWLMPVKIYVITDNLFKEVVLHPDHPLRRIFTQRVSSTHSGKALPPCHTSTS